MPAQPTAADPLSSRSGNLIGLLSNTKGAFFRREILNVAQKLYVLRAF